MSQEARQLRLGFVGYGDVSDPMFASGVPHYLRKGFEDVDGVCVEDISSRPGFLERAAIKALSFRANRTEWERNYLHGSLLPRARSRHRDRGVRARNLDAVLHVRTWYKPTSIPYASFIDATVSMVRGYDVTWDLSDTQFAREIEIEGEFYRRALVVFTASRAATQSLVDDYGVDADRIVQVGAGTTLRGLERIDASVLDARFDVPKILFVGKDGDRKGFPEVLEGFRIFRAHSPQAELIVVGPTTDPAPGEPGVSWHGLVTDKTRLAEFYASASVFALPSHRESYGLVVPEAMSYALPCIVSKAGELPFIVEHGQTGCVLEEISGVAVASRIGWVFADRSRFMALARASLARAEGFTWTGIANRMSIELRRRLGETSVVQ